MAHWIKENVTIDEYNLYTHIESLNIVNIPHIIDYNIENNSLITEKIPNMSISNYYGEKFSDIPIRVAQGIRAIIKKLYDNGVYYNDITGYNFIEWHDEIWIVDVEHASLDKTACEPFIEKLINGHNGWNPLYI